MKWSQPREGIVEGDGDGIKTDTDRPQERHIEQDVWDFRAIEKVLSHDPAPATLGNPGE
jgi:hypothetical protein